MVEIVPYERDKGDYSKNEEEKTDVMEERTSCFFLNVLFSETLNLDSLLLFSQFFRLVVWWWWGLFLSWSLYILVEFRNSWLHFSRSASSFSWDTRAHSVCFLATVGIWCSWISIIVHLRWRWLLELFVDRRWRNGALLTLMLHINGSGILRAFSSWASIAIARSQMVWSFILNFL